MTSTTLPSSTKQPILSDHLINTNFEIKLSSTTELKSAIEKLFHYGCAMVEGMEIFREMPDVNLTGKEHIYVTTEGVIEIVGKNWSELFDVDVSFTYSEFMDDSSNDIYPVEDVTFRVMQVARRNRLHHLMEHMWDGIDPDEVHTTFSLSMVEEIEDMFLGLHGRSSLPKIHSQSSRKSAKQS